MHHDNISKIFRFVIISAKTLNNDDEFSHLIEHALACTVERNNEDVSSVSELRFGTINEVLDVRQMRHH